MKNKKSLLISGAIIIAVVALVLFLNPGKRFGGLSTQASIACTPSTVTAAVVGTTSTTVLAAHSNRAWARIQQPTNASSSIAVAFNTGTDATAASGLLLHAASTTGTQSYIDFGRNTEFPYTGAVTAIVANTNAGLLVAGNASTTLLVTECRY